MAKSTWWLNGCHCYHTKAVSFILTFLETSKGTPNTSPSLKLLDNVVGSKDLRSGRVNVISLFVSVLFHFTIILLKLERALILADLLNQNPTKKVMLLF